METSPAPRIAALRHSHQLLRSVAEPLDGGTVERRSYCSEWSIAQVLSHLGSGAEIFGLWLDAGLNGTDPPGAEAFGPIWDTWNARSPQAQVTDGLAADARLTDRFESLDDADLDRLHVKLFGMDLDAASLAGMRLSEHAVHTWDVAVALDPTATLAPDATDLLVDRVGQVAGRAGKPDSKQRRLRITTTSPERHFTLTTGEAVEITPDGGDGTPDLVLPAEALVRLVYGRLDPAHTPPLGTGEAVAADLRAVFPGM